jgi:hopanoid biosynthesis associated protein HpnK
LQIPEPAAKLIEGQRQAKTMKRLIVNGDDFGLAESVNRGIIVAHRDGILTSTSVLANGPAFEQAIALSQKFPHLTVGVHLNLSAGTPVAPAARITTLVNERGELHLSPFGLWIRILGRQISLEDVHSEFRAQILKVLDAGVTPTHLDGHLHVHILPQLSPIVIALAREFSIRNVRCPAEDLGAALPLLWKIGGASMAALERSAIAYGVSSFARRFREPLRRAGLICPDAFYGLAHTGFLDAKTLSALLDLVPNGTTELMCHPGYASSELESFGGELTCSRETELLALTAPEVREIVGRLGIHLTNFRHLEEDPSD